MYVIQKTPAVNHSGNLFGVIHTTDTGVGVFIEEAGTKAKRKLCEVTDVDYKASGAWLFGWSPNDETFAYSWDRTVHFVDKDGRESSGNIEGITNHFQSFTWLSPDRCAYIDDSPRLALVERVSGKWTTTRFWELNGTNGNPRNIQAVEGNLVGWHTDSILWQTDLVSGETWQVYANSKRLFDDISYSKAADTYLVTASTNRGRYCFLLQVSDTASRAVVKELAHKPSIKNARWINAGRGYVYMSRRGDETSLIGTDNMVVSERTIFRARQLSIVSRGWDDSTIYVSGAKGSEPTAVWRINVDSGETKCVVAPYEGSDFRYRPVVMQTAPYGNRNAAQFEFVPPANFSPTKKYPLVLGLGGYEWSPIAHAIYGQCLANQGAYVVYVNYRWSQRQPETIYAHTNNVMAVYRQLAANPNIDTNRVFLFGFSAGTLVVSELVKQFPGQWRGMMLFNPSGLPEPQEGMTRGVLATAGANERGEERFVRYQEQLAKAGIPMEWHVQQDTQHVPRSKEAMYERTIWMADMVFGK